jgi:hypothetical protein
MKTKREEDFPIIGLDRSVVCKQCKKYGKENKK